MWWSFAIKLFLVDFLWSSFLVFSISAWPRPALRNPAAIVGRLFMYGIAAMIIGTATAIAITSHSDISKLLYFFIFFISLFFALPAASISIEEDGRLMGFAVVTNIVLYFLFLWITLTHPQVPVDYWWGQIAKWIAI